MKAKPKRNGLTGKQRTFVQAYIRTLNASEAMRATGYKGKNADALAARVMQRPAVKHSIETMLSKAAAAEIAGAKARVLRLLETVAGDTAENTRNRLKAAEILGKYAGILTDRVELTGKDGGPVVIQWPNDSDAAT